MLIALTPQGQALREKAKAVPQAILAASACSVGELIGDEERDRGAARPAECGAGGVGGRWNAPRLLRQHRHVRQVAHWKSLPRSS